MPVRYNYTEDELIQMYIEFSKKLGKKDDYWIIGGSEIYNKLYNFIDEIYVTRINDAKEGDKKFFNIDSSYWKNVKIINGIPEGSCCCSNCEEWLVASDEYGVNGTYCPNCGAKMDEVGK